MRKSRLLVIGCGSIGERHLRCFLKTERACVAACDMKPELLERMTRQYGVTAFSNLEHALGEEQWDAAVICTLASTHIPIALRCLQAGLHVLIEKPLALEAQGIPALQEALISANKLGAVGYVLHFLPGLRELRCSLLSGAFGKPLQVSVTTGQHFPTYRPAYREIYYARHETGGGAIQDALTHNVNAVEWLVGPATRIYCDAAHQALEGVSVEDTICVSARHGAVLACYAHNQFQAPNETTYQVHCEKGSLKLEVHEQRWAVWSAGAAAWEYHQAPVKERDQLFIAQANAFLDGIGGAVTDLCTVSEAAQTLKFNLAALQSWRLGLPMVIS